MFRSHQESIISSREHLDRRNNNTPSRSEIFTPNSQSNFGSVGSEIGPSAVNTITFELIERQWRGCMTAWHLSWVLLKQRSTYGKIVNSPTNVKFQPASSVSCDRSKNVEPFRLNKVSASQLVRCCDSPFFVPLSPFKPHYPHTNSPKLISIHLLTKLVGRIFSRIVAFSVR